MNRKTHVSWLIAVGSVGIILGAASTLWVPATVFSGALVVCSAVFCAIGFSARSRAGLVMFLLAGTCFGLWRGLSLRTGYDVYDQWLGKSVELTGRVSEDPEHTEKGTQFRVQSPMINGVPTHGVVWIRTYEARNLKRSYSVSVKGKLSSGFGTIPASMYDAELLELNATKYPDTGRKIRDWFSTAIANAIRGPEAQLGSGILLGQKSALPERLEQDLLALGLTHIVVASGYNLTVLVKVARKLFLRVSRFTALVSSVLLIGAFLAITGLSPSMVRASLVAGIGLVTWYFGRKTHPFVLLSIAGGITVAYNPTYAWGDLGWMLSFLSFTGVLVVAPLLHVYFWGQKQPGILRGVFVETAAAQVMTLPVLMYVFGSYSPLSIFANALVVPSIPIAMACIFLAGVAGLLIAPIAWVFGLPASLLLLYYTNSSQILANSTVAQQEVQVEYWAVLLSYFVGCIVVLWFWKRTKYDFRNRSDDWI